MRLSLSLAALGLLTSAATSASAAASNTAVAGRKPSLRRPAAADRRLIETEGEFTEDQELRQDDLGDEEFEPEAPLNPTNATDAAEPMNPVEPVPENLPEPEDAEPMNPIEPVPENLPEPEEDEPMPENPIELPDNCKDCLGKDSAGAFAFVAEDATGTGSCVASCDNIRLQQGYTCYSGAENDDKVCKDLEKAAEEAAKLAEEAAKLAAEEAAAAAAAEEEAAAPPLPSDLTTCEACLGPDAQGQIYAWFPQLGDAGTCLSGCGVNPGSPCFTGAVYSDENCGGIAEAMARLDEATAAPTDAAEEATGTPTMTEVEATMAPTMTMDADADADAGTGTPTMASMATTGAPTVIILPEGGEGEEAAMEPTSEPSMPVADVPTFVTPEPTMGGDGGVDVEDSIECPEGYTVDAFFAQENGDLCTVCTGPPVTTLPEVEGNSTEPAEPIAEDCTSLCGSVACEFTPAGCGVVICPGDLTADPTAMPTVMTTAMPTVMPTTASPTMMPTAQATTVAPTTMVEPTAAPTTMMDPTDAPSMPESPPSSAGRAVATGIVGAVAAATAYLLMA